MHTLLWILAWVAVSAIVAPLVGAAIQLRERNGR